ncbi:hypothetical protein E8E13_000249 [Curvularia kusanoi]|uniref:Major facilitator superfamily (MFS) profile domain-containing protein n=1 Tax=Curvularia kusanoi TaxID=90978 RepID=A0A9P4W385_CURKU|nr:hypothetical protein E8E13_000249 [Curvularia kusanoi]
MEQTSADSIQMRTLRQNDVAQAVTDVDQAGSLRGATAEMDNYPTGLKFWFITITLGALLILGGLDTNIVATAVPSISNDFHTSADIGWYSSAFRLCSCAFQFIFGKMYTLFSVKRTWLFANVIFLLGSLLCATATSSTMFIVGRAITGAGYAGIIGGTFVILTHILPLRKRPFYCGMLGGVESAAVLAAPILGGVLSQTVGWRWCFWINLPIGSATISMITFLFPDLKPDDTNASFGQKILQLDPVSNLLFIPGLTILFIALSWAGTKYPWKDWKVITLLITFAFLFAAFAINQRRRGDKAALPPRIMKNQNVIAGAIFIMCTNSAANVLEYYLPSYYQIVHEYPPSRAGYMMAPIVVGSALGMFLCGSGTSIVGFYTPFMLFSSVTMPVFAGLITTFGVHTELFRLLLYTGASGLANGIAINAPMSAVQTVLPIDDVSMGFSVMLFAQQLGPAVSVAIAQVVFTNQLSSNLVGLIPNATSTDIGDVGLMEIVSSAPLALHDKVLEGISKSLSTTWYVAVVLTCATLLGSLLMEWRSVKEKNN